MRDNKVPLGDKTKLHYMIDSATELAYINALAAAGQQANTQDPRSVKARWAASTASTPGRTRTRRRTRPASR
jgi:hypothetical protein